MGRTDAPDPRRLRGQRPGGALSAGQGRPEGSPQESNRRAPAGWYQDPGGSGGLRYWSGTAWTDHVTATDSGIPTPESAPAPRAPGPDRRTADPRPGLPVEQRQSWYRPATSPGGQELAGFGRRSAGMLFDLLVVGVAALVVGAFAVAVAVGWDTVIDSGEWSRLLAKSEANPGYQPTEAEALALFGPGALTAALVFVGVWLVLGFCNGVLLVAGSGRTVGDRMVGTRKVRADRHPPGFAAALLRWAIPALLLVAAPLLGLITLPVCIVDHMWPLWDARRRTWHDMAAGTVVERADLIGPPTR